MRLHHLIRNLGLDDDQIRSLEAFLKYKGWEEKEVSSTSKIKHKDLMSEVRIYGRTLFDGREAFIASMNALIEYLIEKDFLLVTKNSTGAKLKCQIDKIYDSTEMKIKLLKYLQGRGRGKRREEIAEHFNISENSLGKRLQELQDKDNHILGTKIKIELERATNQYNSTVHPFFLALNLSEVYGMLTTLMKAEASVPGGTMTDIIKDIVSQLTDYAKGILKDSGLDIDSYDTDVPLAFREESPKNKYYHAMKSGSICRLWLFDSAETLVGRLKFNRDGGREFIFYPEDGGNPLPLDCDDIKDLLEREESQEDLR